MTETQRQVTYNEKNWGRADITEKCNDVVINVCGNCISQGIFRAYGISESKNVLLIGVLEPIDHEMTVKRCFSKSNLKKLGYYPELPQSFFICENKWDGKTNPEKEILNIQKYTQSISKIKKTVPKTKDPLINNILDSDLISWEIAGSLLTVYCEYDKALEFPLSFAFSVCTIEQREKTTVACYRCWLS